jgi:two-component system chemotaxis response regulator CheY
MRKIAEPALSFSQHPDVIEARPFPELEQPAMPAQQIEKLIDRLGVLVVDNSLYMRKLTRTMLMAIGVRSVYEASDGVGALDVIRSANPDMLVIDWDVPVLTGPQVTRIVRSPGVFPKPDLPIIMLTASAQREHVAEALRLGVHEFLVKPTSPKALRDRLLSILVKPRPMVRIGKLYVPQPRRYSDPADAACAA